MSLLSFEMSEEDRLWCWRLFRDSSAAHYNQTKEIPMKGFISKERKSWRSVFKCNDFTDKNDLESDIKIIRLFHKKGKTCVAYSNSLKKFIACVYFFAMWSEQALKYKKNNKK